MLRIDHTRFVTRPAIGLAGAASALRLLVLLFHALAMLLAAGSVMAADSDGKALYAAKNCAFCHGEDGRTSKRDTFPIIAGQMPKYSYLVMQAYKSGERQGVGANLMWEVTDVLTDDEMQRLADYIATLK